MSTGRGLCADSSGSPALPSPKLIVGLGNPGRDYEATRHNVGFLVVDAFARAHKFDRLRRKFQGRFGRQRLGAVEVLLLKPHTYMNLSGHSVRDVVAFHRLAESVAPQAAADSEAAVDKDALSAEELDLTDSLLVVYDDLDLPEGRLRYRASGSSGGHRGVGSIIQELGTRRFSRLRLGIGREEATEAADYVLESLSEEGEARLKKFATVAAETIDLWLEAGVTACGNRFNATAASFLEDDTDPGKV